MLTPEQIELRASGIGASEAAIVAGLSARMTARELYHVKRGELTPDEGGLDAWLGHAIEPVLLLRLGEDLGLKVRPARKHAVHRDLPWMLALPDGLVGRDAVAEAKMRAHGDGWGPSGTDQVPDEVLLQVQQQMACWRRRLAHVVVLIRGIDLRRYQIPRDQGIVDSLIDAGQAFMFHVESAVPPDFDHSHPTTKRLLERLHPGTDGRVVELPPEAEQWHQIITAAKARRAQEDAAIRSAQARLLELIGDAAIGMLPSGGEYNRRERHRSAYTVEPTSYVEFRHIRTRRFA